MNIYPSVHRTYSHMVRYEMEWKENGDDEVDDEREGAGWLNNWKLLNI